MAHPNCLLNNFIILILLSISNDKWFVIAISQTTYNGTMLSRQAVLDHLSFIQKNIETNDDWDRRHNSFEFQALDTKPLIKKADLLGGHLKVLVPKVEPPYLNYVPIDINQINEDKVPPGVVVMILSYVGKELNLTYDFEILETGEWGTMADGKWNGAFEKLIDGDAELVAGGAVVRYDRSLYTDLTFPIHFEVSGMMIRSSNKYRSYTWLIVTDPFSWKVWMIAFCSIIVSGIYFKINTYFLKKINKETQYSIFECTWIFFSIAMQQALPRQPINTSCRTLLAFWWLSSMTLLATFTGSLVALFAVNSLVLPFSNFDGMVESIKSGKYTLLMDINYPSKTEMIAKSRIPSYKDLWNEMYNNHRVDYVESMKTGVQIVKNNPNFVLLGPKEVLNIYAAIECHMVILKEEILASYISIPFKKHSKYAQYFSERIKKYTEYGFIDKWLKDYKTYILSQNENRCNITQTQSKSKVSLGMEKAQGAFYVYVSGFLISVVVLIVEMVFNVVLVMWTKYKK